MMWIQVVDAVGVGLVEEGAQHEEDETDRTLNEDPAQGPIVQSEMKGHFDLQQQQQL